jgi:ABC-type lipoprotein release transport system permease subunit
LGPTAQLGVLVRLSFRSLATHRTKSLIVGGILAFGTFLLALNTTFLNTIEGAMERSVTRSLIGHIQVTSSEAKDDIAFFGGMGGTQDLGVLPDFRKVREVLERVPGVQAVVPMGRDAATVLSGNLLDQKVGELRAALSSGDAARVKALEGRIRQLAELVRVDLEKRKELSSNLAELEAGLAVVARVTADEFWTALAADPEPQLEYLDTKLAPLQEDGSVLFFNYVGTDLDRFAEKFDTFEIVEGTRVPTGERGFLVAHDVWEKFAKNQIARILDELADARRKDGKRLDDERETVLREQARKLTRQYKRIVYELGPDESAQVEAALRERLGRPSDGLDQLVKELLTVSESDFDAKHEAFYDVVAPRIRLHSFRIGDAITLRAFTKSGYQRAQNVKVYGTFRFRGLDGSLLASSYNLVDLMTFRDLYGLMTPERRKELEAIKAKVGVRDVSAADAEDALFGAGGAIEAEAQAEAIVEEERPQAAAQVAQAGPFTAADVDGGVVLNAAVLLKEGAELGPVMQGVEAAAKAAGLGLRVLEWQKAAGMIGQFVLFMRVALLVAFVIIFITALAIINNSMLMSMMDRIMEIGTMRAIGAQRRFVLAMFLLESAVLSVLAILAGLAAAWGTAEWLSAKKLLAAGTNNIMVVLYGGPYLQPHLTGSSVVVAASCIGLVSLVATLYPAVVATRVAPVVAMQRRE